MRKHQKREEVKAKMEIPDATKLIHIVPLPETKPLEALETKIAKKIMENEMQLSDGGSIMIHFHRNDVSTAKQIIHKLEEKEFKVRWRSLGKKPYDRTAHLAIEISIAFY